MKAYKKIRPIISLVCIVALLFSVCSFSVVAADGNAVTATTNASVKQGSSGTCYVYIDSTEGLAALDVTVHFDPAKVKVSNVYNSVSCILYDSVKNADNIQFSYILDGKGSASKTRLFYFYYQVLSNAEVGDCYFDITIGEAYDNSLNDIEVSGSRCKFSITETVTTKTCTASSSSTVSTSVEKEFFLSYHFGTYQLASGSAVINYDPELFEVVEVTNGGFLSNKVTDVNTDLSGAVYISFVGTAYITKYDFVTVKFKTLKNVSEASNIVFKVTELCDKELNPVSCGGYTTKVNIGFDSTYLGDAPKMSVNATFDQQTKKVTAVITLEENSHLGAGDFVLSFDPDILTLTSYQKEFSPTFFNINNKQSAEGVLKFSIISLEDIMDAQIVLSVVFDTNQGDVAQSTDITLDGSVLTDSLTNEIALNFVDSSLEIPPKITIAGDVNRDEILSAYDAIYLLYNDLYGGEEYPLSGNCDFNSSGAVDSNDAVYLLYHVVFGEELYPLYP